MEILNQRLKDYIWENFILFESVFSEKFYKNLLQFRDKQDKVAFNNMLEAMIEIDNGLLSKIKNQYKPIYKMTIYEIIDILKVDSYKESKDIKKYLDRALYFIDAYVTKDENYIRLRTYLSSYYRDIDNHKKAFLYGKESFNTSKKIFKDNHPTKIASYANFAKIYEAKGDYKKALSLYHQATEMAHKIYGENDTTIASLYNNMAFLYEKIGEFKKALFFYEISLKITKKIFGENHPNIALRYNNLGLFYSTMKDFEKALVYYHKALTIQEESFGLTHIDTANSYENIGLTYHYQGKYKEALFFLNKSLEIFINKYGENHSRIATTYNNLGLVYEAIGEYNIAKEFYEKNIEIVKNIFRYNHISLASSYNNLGHLYHITEEYNNAEIFYLKSMKIREKILGKKHLDLVESYNNIGGLYSSLRSYRKAEKFYLKALKIKESFSDKEDIAMANIYNNLGTLYLNQRKYNEALKFFIKALKIKEDKLGEENLDTLSSYSNLAFLYAEKGDYVNAELLFIKVSNIREKVFGVNNYDTVNSYIHLVEFYFVYKRYEKSIYFFEKISKIIEEMLVKSSDNIWKELKDRLLESEEELKKHIKITYLEGIKIKDYFSIKDIEIDDLKSKKEIYFVGENGDGKTILLQAIALALKGDAYLKSSYIDDNTKETMSLKTIDDKFSSKYIKYKNIDNLFAYGINRNKIHYEDFDKKGYSGLFDTSDFRATTFLKDPRKVLESREPLMIEFVKKLNSDILINNLQIETNPLLFKEDKFPIAFDKLSEGYKSTIIWLCDLVSRLIENQSDITDLKELTAIVLIDEVDLYLHPKWKYSFMNKLRKIFPNIQFIMTTHSLVTVLGASEDAVFYKVYKDEKGNTKVAQQVDDISYYTSDILMTSPLFNLETIKSRQFNENEQVSSDDYIYYRIHKKIKEQIDKMPQATDNDVDSWLDDAFDEEFGED